MKQSALEMLLAVKSLEQVDQNCSQNVSKVCIAYRKIHTIIKLKTNGGKWQDVRPNRTGARSQIRNKI